MNPVANPLYQHLLSRAEINELLKCGAKLAISGIKPHTALGGRIGEQQAQRIGSGLDYAETRLYQRGDEPRHIHWRATARSGKMQVRHYHQDINPVFCCVVDRRATMRFGTRCRLKVTQAVRLALLLAARENAQGTECAALILDKTLHWLPPAGGATALQKLAGHLNTPCPPLEANVQTNGLRSALDEVSRRLSPGSKLVLISDFSDADELETGTLARLARRFQLSAYALYDAAEKELPATGPLLLCWNGKTRLMDGRDKAQAQEYTRAWQQRKSLLNGRCQQAGLTLHTLASAENDLPALLAGGNKHA